MIKHYYEVALVLFWQGKLYEHLMFITQGCELQKMSCAMCNMDRLAPAPSTQLGGLKNCPNWKPNRARQFARHNQAFGKVETSHTTTTTTLGGGRREQPRHQRILRI